MMNRQLMSDSEDPNPGAAARVFPCPSDNGNTLGETGYSGVVFPGGYF